MSAQLSYGRLEGTWAEFRADVRTAVSAWKSVPWLVIIGVLLYGPGSIAATSDPTFAMPSGTWVPLVATVVVLLLVALFVFTLGWSGAERLTYAWVWSGSEVRFGTAASAVWGFVGRFFVLAVLLFVPVVVCSLVMDAVAGPVVGTAVSSLLVGLVLTFVTPVLAYDEERATRALGRGLRMLGSHGRRAFWYALMGPAVLSVLLVLGETTPWVDVMCWVLGGVAAAALRGATAAAYLRLTRPAGITGPPPAVP